MYSFIFFLARYPDPIKMAPYQKKNQKNRFINNLQRYV